ncbi:MAG: hypothetical protein AAGH78_04665 [Cyanobacteria bacterium P01_H01_bin.58]
MSPALLVSLPFILILFLAQGSKPTKPKTKEVSIEKVADLLGNQGDEIIIIRKQSSKKR